MIKLKYIITGTGRSGTVFMARFLTSIGVVCGHECIFNTFGTDHAERLINNPHEIRTSLVSGDSWLTDSHSIVADSSYMAAPYLDHSILDKVKVIHVVRNPIKVISSFVNDLNYFQSSLVGSSYENFIYGMFPELYKDSLNPAERACLFYVKWNEMIENKAKNCMRFRIEDDPESLLPFLDDYDYNSLKCFSDKKANTMQRGKIPIQLKNIPNGCIKDSFISMAQKYGYNVDIKVKVF